jgi:hypothetical protein
MDDKLYKQSWAVGIGATVIQNQLQHHLSASILFSLSTSKDITYAIIPQISSLPPPLSDAVREAFAHSINIFWKVLLAFCAVGLFSVFFQKDIPLHEQMDENWRLEDGPQTKKDGVAESAVIGPVMTEG